MYIPKHKLYQGIKQPISNRVLLLAFGFILASIKLGKAQEILETIKDSTWTIEDARAYASVWNDPESWDLRSFQSVDMADYKEFGPLDLPLADSPFPTPEYYSPGNGSFGASLEIGGKNIQARGAEIAMGAHSHHLFEDSSDERIRYFTIITITDSLGQHGPAIASSRNHPHYLFQGSFNVKTKSRIDFIAIQAANGDAYAVVNGRIFDLRAGRVIWVAPQEDGSIRFYQHDVSVMDKEQWDDYLLRLKELPKAMDFFTKSGNI